MATIGISKRYIGVGVLIAFVGLSLWLQREEQVLKKESATGEQNIDYYLNDFVVTVMDEHGRPESRLEAGSMMHYVDGDRAELIKPHLDVYRIDGTTWSLDADKAMVYEGGNRAWLQNAVNLQHVGEDNVVEMTMKTRDLWLYPQQELAETQAAVEIKSELGVTRGVGMEANLKRGYVHLLADVRGEYVQAD